MLVFGCGTVLHLMFVCVYVSLRPFTYLYLDWNFLFLLTILPLEYL